MSLKRYWRRVRAMFPHSFSLVCPCRECHNERELAIGMVILLEKARTQRERIAAHHEQAQQIIRLAKAEAAALGITWPTEKN